MFPYLRIAFSATCGIACVLLIVLWVRSYTYRDTLDGSIFSNRVFRIRSSWGVLWIVPFDAAGQSTEWRFESDLDDPKDAEMTARLGTDAGFAYLRAGPVYVFAFPHWLPVISVLCLAAIPWIRQFSLRTLLLATTLVAVALGLIVAVIRWPAG